jgi:hypothetical protein
MLISEGYAKQQAALHATGEYGTAGGLYAPIVGRIIEKLEVSHLLDYGCGSRMSLLRGLKKLPELPLKTYQAYDPGAGDEKLATAPVPAEMVACIDVLEHIEPDCLDKVLDHLKALTECIAFLTIHTGPAVKKLADGRNAHLTQQPMEWWLPKLWSRFDLQTVQVAHDDGFYVIAYAKPSLQTVDGENLTDDPKIYIAE